MDSDLNSMVIDLLSFASFLTLRTRNGILWPSATHAYFLTQKDLLEYPNTPQLQGSRPMVLGINSLW